MALKKITWTSEERVVYLKSISTAALLHELKVFSCMKVHPSLLHWWEPETTTTRKPPYDGFLSDFRIFSVFLVMFNFVFENKQIILVIIDAIHVLFTAQS